MVFGRISLIYCTIIVIAEGQQFVRECARQAGLPSCVCQTDNGVVDLTEISRSNSLLTANEINSSATYRYNPCVGFDEGASCTDVSGCQISSVNESYSLGAASTETMYIVGNSTVLYYTGGDGGRSMYVRLHCDINQQTPLLTAEGDKGHPLFYIFDLHTNCACPGVCASNQPSVGAAIGITFGVLILVLIIGVLVTISIVLVRNHKKNFSGNVYHQMND